MEQRDPRFRDSSEEERLEVRDEVREERRPVDYDRGAEAPRAFGGLYLFLIVLAIVILAVALVVIFV